MEKKTKDSTAMVAQNADNYNPDVARYRTAGILNAITSFAPDLSEEIRENVLVDLIILAHHKDIGMSAHCMPENFFA